MAADNESTTRAAAERRRLNLVITAFRGLGAAGDTADGCASPSGPTVSPAASGSGTMFKRTAAGSAGSSPGSG